MKKIIFIFSFFLIIKLSIFSADLTELKFYLFNKSISYGDTEKYYWLNNNLEIVKKAINDYERRLITANFISDDLKNRIFTTKFNVNFDDKNFDINFEDNNCVNVFPILNYHIIRALDYGNIEKAVYITGLFSALFFDLTLWTRTIDKNAFYKATKNRINNFENIFSDFSNYLNSKFFIEKFDVKIKYDKIFTNWSDISLLPELMKDYLYQKINNKNFNKETVDALINYLPEFEELIYADKKISLSDLPDTYINSLCSVFNNATNYLYEILYNLPLPDTSPPMDVLNFRAIPEDGAVALNWNFSPDKHKITEQLLYVNRGIGYEIPIKIPVDVNSFRVKGLVNEKKYFFKLVVKKTDELVSAGAVASAVPQDVLAPEKVKKVEAIAGNEKVILKWLPVSDKDIKFIRIYKGENINDFKLLTELEPSINYFEIHNLQNKKEYFFKITTIDEVPNESIGEIVNAIPQDTTAPEPITNLQMMIQSEKLTLSWTPSKNSEKDAIAQIVNLYSENTLLKTIKLPVEQSTYVFENLKNDKLYEVEIYVVDEANNKSEIKRISGKPNAELTLFKKYSSNEIPFDINQHIKKITISFNNKLFAQFDYNNDAISDLIILSDNYDLIFYEGQDEINYLNKSKEKNIAGQSRTNFITIADLNNDNYNDIILSTSGFWEEPIKILLNNKSEKFEESAKELNLDILGECKYATILDVNNDNLPDIYFSFADDKRLKGTSENRLFIQNANNKFIDISQNSLTNCKLNTNYAVSADFNLDGFDDLFISNDNGTNILYINGKNNVFIDKTKDFEMNQIGGIPIVFDYQDDGDYDLLLFYPDDYSKNIFFENQLNTFRYIKIVITDNYEKYVGSKIVLKQSGSDKIIKTLFVSNSSLIYIPNLFSFIFAINKSDALYNIEVYPVSSEKYFYSNVKAGSTIKLF
ncbi:MAG TPA: hypothetical protein PK189_05150 [bacterium]|nr:hypothetical protein [bacterium]